MRNSKEQGSTKNEPGLLPVTLQRSSGGLGHNRPVLWDYSSVFDMIVTANYLKKVF